MYYILTTKPENDEEDAILQGKSAYLVRIKCSFQEGLALPSEDIDTPILFKLNECSVRGKMTDHLCLDDIPGPIFSLKAKDSLERIGITNIEYYQLKLLDHFSGANLERSKKPIEYTNYFIANVVGLVDCVDHENSVLEYFYPPELRDQQGKSASPNDGIIDPFADENPNDIDFITKLVLDETKIDPALKVFRLLDQPNLLIFHESVVDLIKKARLSGFVFVPVSEYTEVIPDDDKVQEESKKETEQKEDPKKTKNPGFNFSLG